MKTNSSIPQIGPLSFIGLVGGLFRDSLTTLVDLTNSRGGLIKFNLGKHQQLHLVSDPDVIKHILKTNKSNYKRSPVIKALKPLLGDGIFISEDDLWASQNRNMKPHFHEKVVRDFETQIGAIYRDIKPDTELVEIESWSKRFFLTLLLKTQFNSELKLDVNAIVKAHEEVLEITNIKNQKLNDFRNTFRLRLGLSKKNLNVNDAVMELQEYSKNIVKFCRSNQTTNSHLIQDYINRGEDDQALNDLVTNLIFAGYDTTASALTWIVSVLGSDLASQQILRESLHGEVRFTTLKNAPQLKSAVQEGLRLYPPVWSIHRQAMDDDLIEDFKVKKGDYFMICTYTLHRRESLWKNPNKFDINRFINRTTGKAFEYIPFGQGERICIGQQLALMELQWVAGNLIQDYEFKSIIQLSTKDIVPGIIMKSKTGIDIQFNPLSNSVYT